MTIRTICLGCGQNYRFADKSAGRRFRCKEEDCGIVFTIASNTLPPRRKTLKRRRSQRRLAEHEMPADGFTTSTPTEVPNSEHSQVVRVYGYVYICLFRGICFLNAIGTLMLLPRAGPCVGPFVLLIGSCQCIGWYHAARLGYALHDDRRSAIYMVTALFMILLCAGLAVMWIGLFDGNSSFIKAGLGIIAAASALFGPAMITGLNRASRLK